MGLFLIIALVVAVPALALNVLQGGPDPTPNGERPDLWNRLTPRRVLQTAAFAILGWGLLVVVFKEPKFLGFCMFLGALLLVVFFLQTWQREFLFLMSLRDEAFPGRHDKLIWAVLLTAAAPIGLWFFRSYRRLHWPAPKPEPIYGRTVSDLF